MPPTNVTAPTTPNTAPTVARSAGRTWAEPARAGCSRARLAPTAAGTGAPARDAAPTMRTRPPPAWRRLARVARTDETMVATTAATPTSSAPPKTYPGRSRIPTSGSNLRASPIGKRVERSTAVIAATTMATATVSRWGSAMPRTRFRGPMPMLRSGGTESAPAWAERRKACPTSTIEAMSTAAANSRRPVRSRPVEFSTRLMSSWRSLMVRSWP